MKENTPQYGWAAYYRSAYEREKKKNRVLAGKIADAEAKEEELSFKLERIQNNMLWKLSKPIRKCYRILTSCGSGFFGIKMTKRAYASTGDVLSGEEARNAYWEEVFRQKHPYLQWIAQKEDAKQPAKALRTTASDEGGICGWKRFSLEEEGLCAIVCGCGVLEGGWKETVKSWFSKNPQWEAAYADEDYYWKDLSCRMHPWFKPCWSPDTLLAFCYIGHMLIVRQDLYDRVINEKLTGASIEERSEERSSGRSPEEALDTEDFYDFCLRLEEAISGQETERNGRVETWQGMPEENCPERIGHIGEVLFHNAYEPDTDGAKQIEEAANAGGDPLEAAENWLQKELEQGRGMETGGASFRRVREAALQRRRLDAHLQAGPEPDIYHVVYGQSGSEVSGNRVKGLVSVIIPSKDHPDVLERCLSSFREKTVYRQYEWIVVDNGSSPEHKAQMERLQEEYGFRYLYEPMPFNFPAMCNMGARKARGEYLLLLNDDVEVIQKDWLGILAGQAGQPHTGATGAKLWYADGENIQHAGITNLDIGPSHKLITFCDDRNYYYGHNQVVYDMIGVTAACLLLNAEKYWEVGGMDEEMAVAYNDVDLCFKLAEAGYYNVLRNDAVLYHYESVSRGLDEEDDVKWERLLREKESLYGKHPNLLGRDGFYHKELIDNASNYMCNFKFDYEKHLKTNTMIEEQMGVPRNAVPDVLRNVVPNVLQLTVDRAMRQHKIHREEPDIFYIMGWSYLPGRDNAAYARQLVLQHEDGTVYRTVPFPWYRKDVENILPEETNICLSGFVFRAERRQLKTGVWKIGMLAEAMDGGKRFLTWSEKKLNVD